tara:strand:- start:1191 stop:1499 length:309 start_codon:yes stop_codon:yes gene_type:complete
MSDFSKQFLGDSSVFLRELNLMTEEERAKASEKISGYLKMKSIMHGERFYHPSQSDFDDAGWLLKSSLFTINAYERSYLDKLSEAFKAKEAMPSTDYNNRLQ